jgi:hypothetical protein
MEYVKIIALLENLLYYPKRNVIYAILHVLLVLAKVSKIA